VLALLLVLALAGACSRPAPANAASGDAAGTPTADATTAGTPQTAAPVKPVPAQLPDVIARVNGETISRADFEGAVATLEANAGAAVPANERDAVYRQVLDQMIGIRLLIQETRARKMTLPNADIEARLAQFRSQFPTEEAFTQTLEQQKVTLEQLRSNALNDLLVQKLLDTEIEPKAVVTPAQVDEFYKNNPDQFQQGERVRASHILFGFPQGADDAARQLARTRAATVLQELKSGKDFGTLAKLHSQDTGSAGNGGDLGYFQQGQMVPPFEKAAFALKPGQTSDLVESEFGVHIIRVVDHQAARTLPLDEIRPQLQQFIQEQKRQEQTAAFVNGLKAKSKVEIYI
jgi:peptidyl-prolyl cis-trans isomerase C